MAHFNITEKELFGAFYSKHRVTGRSGPTTTCGIAHYHGKVVGAVYRRDKQNPMEWVIITCWAYNKTSRDIMSEKRYWKKKLEPYRGR